MSPRTVIEYPDPRHTEAYVAVIHDDDDRYEDAEPVLVVRVMDDQREPYLDIRARERQPDWERADSGAPVADGAALWPDAAPLLAQVMNEAAEVMASLARERQIARAA